MRSIVARLLTFGMTVAPPCALLVVLTPRDTAAQQRSGKDSSQENPRWSAIRQVFGQGKAEGNYFRVDLPRTDLHVRIGADTLEPGLELTSYVGFMPAGTAAADLMAMGEVVVREDEVPAALTEARKQGVSVTALHNHLLSESPHVMYMHVMAEGSAKAIATKMHAVFAATATPLEPQREQEGQATNAADWSVIDGILGKHSEAEGRTAEYEFPRHERLTVHGKSVKSVGTLETASEVVFQRLGPGRVATAGELYLLTSEVEAVLRALDEHGLHPTALHNHMLDDGPPHYWVHWYATGDDASVATGVSAALALMNGARKASQPD
jgi:Domain of Unknown Function (DUF1259)